MHLTLFTPCAPPHFVVVYCLVKANTAAKQTSYVVTSNPGRLAHALLCPLVGPASPPLLPHHGPITMHHRRRKICVPSCWSLNWSVLDTEGIFLFGRRRGGRGGWLSGAWRGRSGMHKARDEPKAGSSVLSALTRPHKQRYYPVLAVYTHHSLLSLPFHTITHPPTGRRHAAGRHVHAPAPLALHW